MINSKIHNRTGAFALKGIPSLGFHLIPLITKLITSAKNKASAEKLEPLELQLAALQQSQVSLQVQIQTARYLIFSKSFYFFKDFDEHIKK